MEPVSGTEVDLEAFVADLPNVQLKAGVPLPIRHRVDLLADFVAEVRALGGVSRDELVAALLFTAEWDPAALGARVVQYREARVWQAVRELRKRGLYTVPPARTGRRPSKP